MGVPTDISSAANPIALDFIFLLLFFQFFNNLESALSLFTRRYVRHDQELCIKPSQE
jgi:hypothetical protein